MMVDFKWIQISLFLVAELQFTAAAEQLRLSSTVRVGDDVTLSCKNVMDGQQNCDTSKWLYSDSPTIAVVELGKIVERDKSKSDRLSVTGNCSLVIKKVTVQDAGQYTCRQIKSGRQQGPDSQVLLSVVTISPSAPVTEQKNTDVVTLNCSVSTFEPCSRYTVKWLFQDRDVDKDNKDVMTSQSLCSASVNFKTSHFIHTSKFEPLKCEVTDGEKKEQKFPFSPRPSGEKPGEETTTTTQSTTTTTGTTGNSVKEDQWWLIVAVVAAVAVLLIIVVVVVIRRKKTKRNQRQMDENSFVAEESNGLNSNPAATPGTSQDTADPEDGVSYASVSYTKKTDSKARALGKNRDDDDEAVTYSTVKPSSSSSAGASADPSSLYATIN